MAHVKLALKDEVLASDLPDQEVFASRLPRYFPTPLRDEFGTEIRSHQLRREIVTTMLVNDLVDTGGITYAYRITEDVGVGTGRRGALLRRHRRDLPHRARLAADPRRRRGGQRVAIG